MANHPIAAALETDSPTHKNADVPGHVVGPQVAPLSHGTNKALETFGVVVEPPPMPNMFNVKPASGFGS